MWKSTLLFFFLSAIVLPLPLYLPFFFYKFFFLNFFLKLLPDTNNVSGWHIKQYIKMKVKVKEWSQIKILIVGKHTSDRRIIW